MYFTIRKNADGYYWWRAVADGNNEILASSELLSSNQACTSAIAIVKAEAAQAPVYDKTGETSVRGRA
jgi:uncharacterized protein YegP (UPF0339 family)